MDSGESLPTALTMKRVSKSQGGFKWSREKLLSYLGGDEGDLNILKIELTDLLLEHDKMYTSCKTRDGRAQQKMFILAHIIKLKPYVQDCNLRRLEGLMGLARVVKRSYKAGERYRSVTVRMSQIPQKEGEENDGTEGGPKDKIVIVTNIPTEPRPEPEPEEPGQARSVDDAKTLFLNCNIETVHANEDMVSTDAIGHENSVVVAPRSDVEMVSSTTLDTINPNHERFPNTVEEKPSPNDVDMASTATTFDTPGPVGSGHDDFFSTVREQILPNDVDRLSAIDNRDSVEPSHENFIDTAEEQTLPNVLDILFASRTFNTRDPVKPSHEEFIDTAEEQTLHNDVEMVFTPTPTPTPDTSKPIQPNQLSQPIEPKPQIPQIVVKARNLLAKRQVPTHHFSDFGLNLLARNIWVVNEADPNRHGLCAIQELRIVPYYPIDRIPCLTDLNFIEWVITTKEQCGYGETIHRLEYRPSVAISPLVLGKSLTVPVASLRQWRGALNAQLRDEPDKDPVFYLILKCKLVLGFFVW